MVAQREPLQMTVEEIALTSLAISLSVTALSSDAGTPAPVDDLEGEI